MKITNLLTALSVAVWLAGPVFSQDQKPMHGGPEMKMKMHEEMSTEMKAMDEKLDKLVIDMNTATTPEKKLEAAIAVINEMVAQHKKMHEKAAQRWHEHHNAEGGASPMGDAQKKE